MFFQNFICPAIDKIPVLMNQVITNFLKFRRFPDIQLLFLLSRHCFNIHRNKNHFRGIKKSVIRALNYLKILYQNIRFLSTTYFFANSGWKKSLNVPVTLAKIFLRKKNGGISLYSGTGALILRRPFSVSPKEEHSPAASCTKSLTV